ncbi:MAG: hypothetical protein V4596_00945 [Bdellovibrionota bacterium]
MKNTLFALLFVLIVGSIQAAPPENALPQRKQGFAGFEKGQSAVSFFAGQPTFFRYDKFINWKRAWNIDAGYHFDKYPYFAANYAVYFYNIRDRLKEHQDFFNSLLFYAGPGVFFGPDFGEEKSSEKVKIGLRIYGGTEYIFKNSPWSLKAEIGPSFFIEGDDDFIGFQGMLGVTYYIGGIKTRKLKSRITNVKDNTEMKVQPTSSDDEATDDEFKQFD